MALKAGIVGGLEVPLLQAQAPVVLSLLPLLLLLDGVGEPISASSSLNFLLITSSTAFWKHALVRPFCSKKPLMRG